SLRERLDAELARPKWEDEIRAWELVSLHRPGDVLTIRHANEEVRGEYLGLDPAGFLRLKAARGRSFCPASPRRARRPCTGARSHSGEVVKVAAGPAGASLLAVDVGNTN